MYAFRAGLPVPPELATVSDKRVSTGNLTEDHLIEIVNKYQPEQILIGRFNFPLFETYIRERYTILHVNNNQDNIRLFIRSDLIP